MPSETTPTEELKKAVSLLNATLESTADGILVIDQSGKMSAFNRIFARMWRIPQDVLDTHDDAKALAHVMEQLKDPQSFVAGVKDLYNHPEAEVFDVLEFKDGRAFERFSKPQRIDGKTVGRVWSFRDITERRRLEAQLLQTEKLSAMGQMAAGVAHEINNPLSVILGFAQGVLNRMKPNDPSEMPLKAIEQATLRCRNFVQSLLTFSRASGTEPPGPVAVNDVVREALPLIKSQAKMVRVEVADKLAVSLPSFLGNKNQVEQVLVNLTNNALDAMPSGGTLTLETGLEGPEWVCLKVSDTGTGIPREVLDKVFTPFFTTKPAGRGTGLGLSLVNEIVKKHGGDVGVESRPGKTEFRVKFPAMGR